MLLFFLLENLVFSRAFTHTTPSSSVDGACSVVMENANLSNLFHDNISMTTGQTPSAEEVCEIKVESFFFFLAKPLFPRSRPNFHTHAFMIFTCVVVFKIENI